jgi:hypothetical protein
MSDEWVKEAGRIGDELGRYADWVESHEEEILDSYREFIGIDDIPDDYIGNYYDRFMQGEE